MRFVIYTHSLLSDWNHGNAHFLRGVMRELIARGHAAEALEPAGGWSLSNLRQDQGPTAIERFRRDFPGLSSTTYDASFDHEAALADADVVIVHEWTEPSLVAEIGRIRRRGGRFTLLFHDTHHRAVSDEGAIADLLLQDYDGVLAFGETLRERYLSRGWGRQVFTWHEAADTALFRPVEAEDEGELVWIGNWGDGERERELVEFLIEPATTLGLTGSVHGVRYPQAALDALARSPLAYRGYVANADVPKTFARHRMTVHVPRRPYVEALPGIPTIRVFEALACGIPLVCAPWSDAEGLFRPGDYLTARDGTEMTARLGALRSDPDLRAELAGRGLETIRRRHSCGHRVEELEAIVRGFRTPQRATLSLREAV
jgi:spore maturation protein CgeB